MSNTQNQLPLPVRRAKANGSMSRINQCISLASLLIYEANNLMSEAEDILIMNGLKHGRLKMLFNRYIQAKDQLCLNIYDLVRIEGKGNELCDDLDELDNYLREVYDLPKDWKPLKNVEL